MDPKDMTCDLAAQKIIFVANGKTISAKIKTPLSSIVYVGYVMDSALIDVAPVEIESPAAKTGK